jgi:hypothetical protein
VFGFTDIEQVTAPRVHGERTYILTLEALKGRVPVVVSPADDLDHASANLSHDRRRPAASSLREWLNAEDNALWGLCCNGERLRLFRDNQSLARLAFSEANLRQIFENEDFAGFAALHRLRQPIRSTKQPCHRLFSRTLARDRQQRGSQRASTSVLASRKHWSLSATDSSLTRRTR